MNIWQLIEYTMAISTVALLLLLMKRLFHDKLDARWHYFIWAVLFARMVVPLKIEWLKSPLSLFEAIPVGYWTDILALKAERAGLNLKLQGLLIWYLVGVGLLSVYYVVVAVIVRVRTLRLKPANQEICDWVAEIAKKYGLNTCKKIRITSQGTPYVSGWLNPVLVLPVHKISEEAVIHELLHKKYGDVCINYGLHLIRVFNWFNPLIWYATAVILNDSEALCDQRVLELLQEKTDQGPVRGLMDADVLNVEAEEHTGGRQAEDAAIEKKYGSLLISMAEQRGTYSAKIGTTNMANSYRNMKTRIKRITDFRRVPGKVGFVALCITVIMGVSGIGSCEAKTIISCGVENERDLNNIMLRAMTYKAQTKEEAVYLYLKAMRGMNPIYLIPVMPKDDLPAYEGWIYEMYRQEKFIQWHDRGKVYLGAAEDSLMQGVPEWMNLHEEIVENPWFVHNGMYMRGCNIYNLTGDSSRGSAVAEVIMKNGGSTSYISWELELLYEDGWKVKRTSENIYPEPQTPAYLVQASAANDDWMIEAGGWNEGYFSSVFPQTSGLTYYAGSVPTLREREENAEYPKEFEMYYKHVQVNATYLGEEPLDGKKLVFETQISETLLPMSSDVEEPDIKVVDINSMYASSDGSSRRSIPGEQIKKGEPILLNGYGGGYNSWSSTEEIHFTVRIYYDGTCVGVIRQ